MDFLFFFLSHNVNYVNFYNLKMKPCASGLKKKSIPFSKITTKDKSVCSWVDFVHMSCKCAFPINVFCMVSSALFLLGVMSFVIKLA